MAMAVRQAKRDQDKSQVRPRNVKCKTIRWQDYLTERQRERKRWDKITN